MMEEKFLAFGLRRYGFWLMAIDIWLTSLTDDAVPFRNIARTQRLVWIRGFMHTVLHARPSDLM